MEGLLQLDQMQRGELRFLPLHFIENIFLNVFPEDEGLQEVPPDAQGPQVPPHK